MGRIQTPLTDLFNIEHPVLLAGMNVAAGPKLAAAVTNAGGLGVIGGLRQTPAVLRSQIRELKTYLDDPHAPFGVDLLLPKIGEGARKTNYDYTQGKLDELIDIIIEEKTTLFVCAVGVPSVQVVHKLHDAGVFVMNMVGHPKHVAKALAVGVDLICAQGGEGGGHTGDIPSSILIPACVDAVKGHTSALSKGPVHVVGAGGVYDGRGLAANLMWGAVGVWVGTRFVASVEAAAPKKHKDELLSAGVDDTVTTLIYSGRPMRVRRTEYIDNWNNNRQEEIKQLTSKGNIPMEVELQKHPELSASTRRWLMGRVAGLIQDVLPAKQIVEDMVGEASRFLESGKNMTLLAGRAKL